MKTIILILILVAPLVASAVGVQTITPQRVMAMMKEGSGLWLVDLRNSAAYGEVHPEGAMNIPFEELTVRRLPSSKLLVLVDDSLGLRKARQGAELLAGKGYEKVYLLEGGLPGWQSQGLPIAGSSITRWFRRVTPDDIRWARDNRIYVKLYDIRNSEEATRTPLPSAEPVAGGNVADRLAKVGTLLTGAATKPGVAAPPPAVIIFPTDSEPEGMLAKASRFLPGDVRYLEGGHVVWSRLPEEKRNMRSLNSCPTCPGGTAGTTRVVK